jgi:hypothetical protein
MHHPCATLVLLMLGCTLPRFVAADTNIGLGVIVYLADSNSSTSMTSLRKSLTSVDAAFNARPETRYPVIVFHDTVRGDLVPLMASYCEELAQVSAGPLKCVAVDLAALVPAAVLEAAPTVSYGKSIGYRLMCNFFAGHVARHSSLAGFRFYMRMDTDSFFLEHDVDDPIRAMLENNWRYGYIGTMCDLPTVIAGFIDVATTALPGAIANLPPAFSDNSCADFGAPRFGGPGDWNLRIIYNNFEIVELDWLRSPDYLQWYDAVLSGIMRKRWGDAPVRTLAVFALLPLNAIHVFDKISYEHQGFFGPYKQKRLIMRYVHVTCALFVVISLVVGLLCRRGKVRISLSRDK